MHVLLVEDHRLVADAFQAMLREVEPGLEVTACYSTQHALSALDAGTRFDLVITDLYMPGIGGIGLLDAIRNRRGDLPVVVVSGSDDERSVRAAMEHGAAGFIPKTLPGAEMVAGVREVIAGRRFFPERHLARPVAALSGNAGPAAGGARESRPGSRQMQVLRLMADGHSNKQISQIVGIKEATVKYHTSQLFKQFGVRNRTSCVREAQSRGLVEAFGAGSAGGAAQPAGAPAEALPAASPASSR